MSGSSPQEVSGSTPEREKTLQGIHGEQPVSTNDRSSPTDGNTETGREIRAPGSGAASNSSITEISGDSSNRAIQAPSGRRRALRSGNKKVRQEAKAAGINAAKSLWGQAPTLLPLLGVFLYGLGRFEVDGFYARLDTTADAAGVGYLSIIEPAAVLAAIIAIVGTAMVILFDMFNALFLWIAKNRVTLSFILAVVGMFAATGSIVATITHSNLLESVTNVPGFAVAVLPLTAYSIQSLVKVFRNPTATVARLLSVGFSLTFLAALCFGAHELGVREAAKATRGQAVDVRVLGLDMSVPSATPVYVRVVDPSPVLKQLIGERCFMEIGSGASDILLYDLAKQSTLSVPSSEVVVINSSASCRK